MALNRLTLPASCIYLAKKQFTQVVSMLDIYHIPGMVLSKIKATQPPTNIAVVRRTFST